MCGSGDLLVLGLAGVAVEERPLPRGFLGDGVDRGVDPRAVVAELLGGVVAPPARPRGTGGANTPAIRGGGGDFGGAGAGP